MLCSLNACKCHLHGSAVDVVGYERAAASFGFCAFCAASCKWHNDKVAFSAHCFDELARECWRLLCGEIVGACKVAFLVEWDNAAHFIEFAKMGSAFGFVLLALLFVFLACLFVFRTFALNQFALFLNIYAFRCIEGQKFFYILRTEKAPLTSACVVRKNRIARLSDDVFNSAKAFIFRAQPLSQRFVAFKEVPCVWGIKTAVHSWRCLRFVDKEAFGVIDKAARIFPLVFHCSRIDFHPHAIGEQVEVFIENDLRVCYASIISPPNECAVLG